MSDKTLPEYAFAPRPGQTKWWTGDPEQLPSFHPGDRHRHFITRRGVLSREQCQVLIDCFERHRQERAVKSAGEYWSGRYIWQANLPEHEIDAIRLMQQLRFLSLSLLMQSLPGTDPLFSDSAQIVRWDPGIELVCHVDNLEPDGRPNPTPHRAFSSILYLNDGYEGGETYFPGHNLRIKPEAGALVLFGAGPEYVHGVTRVTKGLRYTYAGWFTYDKTMEDLGATAVF